MKTAGIENETQRDEEVASSPKAPRARKAKKIKKSKTGITLNEFADHFAEMIVPMTTGEVEGVAMAVVTADGVMWSTLMRDGITALVLRDATWDLGMECEKKAHDDLIVPCLKQSAGGTVK